MLVTAFYREWRVRVALYDHDFAAIMLSNTPHNSLLDTQLDYFASLSLLTTASPTAAALAGF